jgi:hypothetical protein
MFKGFLNTRFRQALIKNSLRTKDGICFLFLTETAFEPADQDFFVLLEHRIEKTIQDDPHKSHENQDDHDEYE